MNEKNLLLRNQSDTALSEWREKEKKALKLLKIVGELRFDKAVELVIFRKDIYDTRPSEVLDYHRHATDYIHQPVTIDVTLSLAKAIEAVKNMAPAKIDIGRLASEWEKEKGTFDNLEDFVGNKLADFIGIAPSNAAAKDVVLYGFGRIGRLAARRLITTTGRGEQLRLKAIVIRPKLKDPYEEAVKRASLLQKDSVHGNFPGVVEVAPDGSELIINGNRVKLIFAKQPEDIDYTEYGINNALVIDNTGVWRDEAGLRTHLRPGIDQVMLTAPGSDVPNIVYGANQHTLDVEKTPAFSAASCTTNAIVPVLMVMDQQFGIDNGHVETIHAYTNDQNLLDNFHKKSRRGRAAPLNMVLTSTGAAKAVSKVIPHLKGKLTGNAVRVPTPNVSLAILSLSLNKEVSVEQINNALKEASLRGDLVEQLHYSDSTEYVSSQAVGMTSTSVVDAPSTIVSPDGRKVTIYAWYDNEFGYTCQVLRLAKHAANVRRFNYY